MAKTVRIPQAVCWRHRAIVSHYSFMAGAVTPHPPPSAVCTGGIWFICLPNETSWNVDSTPPSLPQLFSDI